MKPVSALALLSLLPVAAMAQGVEAPVAEPAMAENVSYAYAQVLRVDPVYERVILSRPEERCEDEVVYERVEGGNRTAGAVLGAVIGGVIGNQVGKGNGRRAATVAGAIAGGAIGGNVGGAQARATGEEVRPGCRVVEVEREERRLAGYDVEYRYKGDVYMSRLDYDPGDRLRIRVAVSPVDDGYGERY